MNWPRIAPRGVASTIRWACVLEATAPKVGNVHPGHSFDDLRHADFAGAAEVAAEELCRIDQPAGQRIDRAVVRQPSNVNLGIVLLIAPMVRPAMAGRIDSASIAAEIESWTAEDARTIYRVIAEAAGGLGDVDTMDVRQYGLSPGPVDARRAGAGDANEPVPAIKTAMTAAADRDQVAYQYASDFDDLLTRVVPVLRRHGGGDVLSGIARAQIELLSHQADSLIVRKCGIQAGEAVRSAAADTDPSDAQLGSAIGCHAAARWTPLQSGTTADLIAAGLFVCLSTGAHDVSL